MSTSEFGMEETNDHGPLSPGLAPMVVINEWFPRDWDNILGCGLDSIINTLFLLYIFNGLYHKVTAKGSLARLTTKSTRDGKGSNPTISIGFATKFDNALMS